MKNTLTLLFVLSGVVAQAQSRTFLPIEKELMQQSLVILGQRATEEDITRELFRRDSMLAENAKKGVLNHVNLYYLQSRKGKYFNPLFGDYIVTLQNVRGIAPNKIPHPTIKDSTLQSSYFYVPVGQFKPEYLFYAPTKAQIKKLKGKDLETVREGGLLLRKMTKADRKKLGY